MESLQLEEVCEQLVGKQ